MRSLFQKEVFGTTRIPSTLTDEQRFIVIILNNQTRITNEEARQLVLVMIDTASHALTLKPPNDSPSEIFRYQQHLRHWLENSNEPRESFPLERVSGPILGVLHVASSTNTANRPAMHDTSQSQSVLGQQASEHPAIQVSSKLTFQAPHPLPIPGPAQPHPLPAPGPAQQGPLPAPGPAQPHPLPAPGQAQLHPPSIHGPAQPYHFQGPPMQWNPQAHGLVMHHPSYPPQQAYGYHGPIIGTPLPQHGLLAPPQMIQQPLPQPIVLVQPVPIIPVRSSLPPARRQSSQSVWAPSRRGFNVAEWAQEHRPRTPPSSTNVAAQAPNSNPTGGQSTTARYGSTIDTMYPQAGEQRSEQLRSLISNETPGYSVMTDGHTFPFEVVAKNTRPATGGVVRISNVSTAEN